MTYTPPSLPPLGRFMAHRGIHYGWVVAAVTFLTMLVTAGAVGAPGILIGPLKAEFGWNVADISAGFAMRLVLFGLMGPFAAAFMNRFGTRRIAAIALILIGLGTLGTFAMTKLWHLLVLWGVVVGFGTGLTAMVLGATVATQWFSKRRGLVVGLLTASAATGQLVFLPALAALTDQFGWRCALAFILVALLIAVVAVLALMRDRPADLGLLPYGATEPPPAVAQRASLWAMMCSPISNSARGIRFVDLLGSLRHFLHLRRVHQRPCANPFRFTLRGRRDLTCDGGRNACDDRNIRFHWHGRVWMALGSFR